MPSYAYRYSPGAVKPIDRPAVHFHFCRETRNPSPKYGQVLINPFFDFIRALFALASGPAEDDLSDRRRVNI
jgi:hypothetical protein